MPKSNIQPDSKSQLDKFKQTAKEVETDEREAAFDRALKRVAKSAPSKNSHMDSRTKDK